MEGLINMEEKCAVLSTFMIIVILEHKISLKK